ncbi:hypothetical protein LCGC14_1649430 [marine sediment metagenome]|uniref:DUF4007 domain-containing protein n=1 Tax=marine sediment metagenome TaxID=412755 RepID=A0A0F9KD67_9ZZZZ
MRFGGHETFAVREGWLHKGLRMLVEEPQQLGHEDVADYLGVGRNMAKSIRHWLLATGLAERSPGSLTGKSAPLQATPLGEIVRKCDPYFLEIGTWWALHVNLVNTAEHAEAWAWFFNSFNLERFERPMCLESLCRHIRLSKRRMPSTRTLERDIACLLSSYARVIPASDTDPEEARDCPFRELGLLSYFKTSGYYQLHQGIKEIPAEIFGYATSCAFPDAREGDGATDITIHDVARQPGGPGRAFALTSETLFEVASRAEGGAAKGEIEIVGIAGSRAIRIQKKPPRQWLEDYYSNADVEQINAARQVQETHG